MLIVSNNNNNNNNFDNSISIKLLLIIYSPNRNLEVFVFMEGGKTRQPGKKTWELRENQQQTQHK